MKYSLMLMLFLMIPSVAMEDADNDLPKVLIIGDSISAGYFPFVKDLLKGKAELISPKQFDEEGKPTSCEGTTRGVENIDEWLGDTKWDVIHFNFGLHDLKHIKPGSNRNSKNLDDPLQADLSQYEKNLREIVGKLRATGATLIFATTTPYPDKLDRQIRTPGMPQKYNMIALKIMRENDIEVNDLYSFVLPRMEELQRPNNVHFTEAGSQVLAGEVAQAILKGLKIKTD